MCIDLRVSRSTLAIRRASKSQLQWRQSTDAHTQPHSCLQPKKFSCRSFFPSKLSLSSSQAASPTSIRSISGYRKPAGLPTSLVVARTRQAFFPNQQAAEQAMGRHPTRSLLVEKQVRPVSHAPQAPRAHAHTLAHAHVQYSLHRPNPATRIPCETSYRSTPSALPA